jgi:hypothetical protein
MNWTPAGLYQAGWCSFQLQFVLASDQAAKVARQVAHQPILALHIDEAHRALGLLRRCGTSRSRDTWRSDRGRRSPKSARRKQDLWRLIFLPQELRILEKVHALEPEIRAASVEIESERRLPSALARRLMEAGVFRMGVPRDYDGFEVDPMGQVRVVEELSRIEGSVGWLSMISSAGSFVAGFLEPSAAPSLRRSRKFRGRVDSPAAPRRCRRGRLSRAWNVPFRQRISSCKCSDLRLYHPRE